MQFSVTLEIIAPTLDRPKGKVGSGTAPVEREASLDLTEERLRTHFIEKYEAGEAIFINGRTVRPDQIRRIKIWKNNQTSAQVRDAYNQRMMGNAGSGILNLRDPDDAEIAMMGDDVTGDFIHGSPGSIKRPAPSASAARGHGDRIFVIHGHDDAAKNKITRFLEKLGFKAIIFHEHASGGRTIIEKFEALADVDFAVAILTPDDKATSARDASNSNLKPRARQNVVFEMGFFAGKLGRSHVCALVGEQVEKPSDYDGVVYIPLDQGWEVPLARELRNVFPWVDMNKVL